MFTTVSTDLSIRTQENYGSFSSINSVTQNGNKPKGNQRTGGGAGQMPPSEAGGINRGSPREAGDLGEPGFPATTQNSLGDIDKMTFELMANKTQYQRYLSKTDPLKHREHQEYLEKIHKYRQRIMEMTDDFTSDPEKQVTIEVNEAIHSYMKTMIKYFEIKDLEKEGAYHSSSNPDDEDVLFGQMAQAPNLTRTKAKSYWGEVVYRVGGNP